jgi:hypothetical protein
MAHFFWKRVSEKERYDVLATKACFKADEVKLHVVGNPQATIEEFFWAARIASQSLTRVRASHTHSTPPVIPVFPLNSCSCFRCNLYSTARSGNLSARADGENNRFHSLSISPIVSTALLD